MQTQGDGFGSLGIDEALVSAISALGYEEPTAIQREAIPALLSGRDVLGQAATGTGKTAAFALPLLQRIGRRDGDRPIRGLILVPTRELAMQVAEAVHKYGKHFETRVLPIFGGQSIGLQLRGLRRGADVVVATPGRALDVINRGALDLSGVEFLVLDEADEMLDMGFADELDAILEALPEQRQTALFSATMAPRIRAITKKHLHDPVHVTIAAEKIAPGKAPRIREAAYVVARPQKIAALARILDIEDPSSVIIFCRTRTEVDELTETLGARGYEAQALHGGLSQEQRDRVLRRFRDNKTQILVATDVAARGLDIEHVSHVVNYDVPSSPDVYVHRIGRTGRAGREGVAITFAEVREQRLLRNIEQHTKRKIAIESVPTVHDLRAKRLEIVRSSLEAALSEGGLERYRGIVDSLASEYDIYDVAAAAAKLADQARDGAVEDEIEIPAVQLPAETRKTKRERSLSGDVTRMYVGLGRRDGIRPADLVGAIANEAAISSRDIGAIDIADRFSLIEVPTSQVERIVKALRHTVVRGKKLGARRDRK
ncbi:MAG TPA: DEAD/DEAH box helicase [Candidatus Aquilonibacter sp.]|nr:DEAD/DEAH box helicase [Candidatus Aquilonibacter sp.]